MTSPMRSRGAVMRLAIIRAIQPMWARTFLPRMLATAIPRANSVVTACSHKAAAKAGPDTVSRAGVTHR